MADFSDINYKTIFLAGDSISWYANLDTLETNANFSSWDIYIVHADSFIKALVTLGINIQKDIISGSDYRFFAQDWTFPSTIGIGCYRIVIEDTSDGNLLYISNEIEVITDVTDTLLIRYRNAKNIQNFNYEKFTTLYNVVRVPLIKRKSQRPITSEGYDTINGAFQRVRTAITKSYEFLTDWFDEEAHDALDIATLHSTFEVFENEEWVAYNRPSGSDYQANFEEEYPLIEASIRLEQSDFSSTNKAL